jgi:pyrrolidone-carboxylate peptidase
MRRSRLAPVTVILLASSMVGCADDLGSQQADVVVDTQSEAAWAQYVTDVHFAEGYVPSCVPDPTSGRPRVLVTGFGRFMDNAENATGRMVSRVVPGLEYPLTAQPAPGQVDDPAAQTRVKLGVASLPGVGEVDVCGMVLPVFWDLAAYLVLREAESFEPELVLMNGIAGARQPLWLELGSVNQAVALPDGSGVLVPIEPGAPLLDEAPPDEQARGLLLSWQQVRTGGESRIAALAAETDGGGTPFGDVVQGVRYAGYPRQSNTYLCNNTTYVVGYVLDHAGQPVRLLEPSAPRPGGPTGIDLDFGPDLSSVPREFVHWPKELNDTHLDRGADVMAHLIAAQLTAQSAPTRGDPAMADITE